MPPRSPSEIVPDAELLTEDEIRKENVKAIMDIMFPTALDYVKWLARRGLIANKLLCIQCNIYCSFTISRDSRDGHIFRCRLCSKRKSLRHNSFFSKSNLDLKQLVVIMLCWANGRLQKDTAVEARTSGHTMIDWANYCREVCAKDLIKHPPLLGGYDEEAESPRIVEIELSEDLMRGKRQRGKIRDTRWVLGGVERKTGRAFIVEVKEMHRKSIISIIQE